VDESLLADFVAESREHLDGIEPDLMALDQGGGDVPTDIVNRVFRAIHSIKGGAGFLAFDGLKRLSHAMENVLMEVREGRFSVDANSTDLLLRGVDKLRAMLDDIQASDGIPIDEELEALAALLGKTAAPHAGALAASASVPVASTSKRVLTEDDLLPFNLDMEVLRGRHSSARYLFFLEVNEKDDLQTRNLSLSAWLSGIAPLGDVIAHSEVFPGEVAGVVFVLFTTVLEPELALMALELPEDQVQLVVLPEQELPEGQAEVPKAPADCLGRILIEKFGVVAEDVIAAARTQGEGDRRPIGAILLEAGCVSKEALVEALKVQERLRNPRPTASEPAAAAAQEKALPVADKSSAPTAPETLRVRVDVLTRLMNSTGELVLSRNQLLRALDGIRNEQPGLNEILQNLDLVTTDLQEGVMQTRIQPIGLVFGKFSRLVRDVARTLGKDIALHTFGTEVELDKSIVEGLGDPLTHLVRNSADHGIELPDERIDAGKPRQGNITLNAFHEGGQIHITISDDGHGLNPKKLVKKAIERGILTPEAAATMGPREINNLIFAPGFSTAEQVTDLSGRGVGMDVVRTNIEKLGGVVSIESTEGLGTTISLQLPLTLAIIQSIVVGAGDQRFAIPQVNIEEFVWVRAAEVHERIEHYHGYDVLRLRGRLLPLVHLGKLLKIPGQVCLAEAGEVVADRRERVADRRGTSALEETHDKPTHERAQDRRSNWQSDYNIVVVRAGKNRFGLIVDRLFDVEEIVVKPLAAFLHECRWFSGATILGDGQVILILDVLGVSAMANLHFSDLAAEDKRHWEEEKRKQREAEQHRQSVILLRGGADEQIAMRQNDVARLERVLPGEIQHLGEQEFIEYRGVALPLLRLDQIMPVHPLPDSLAEYFMVIPKQPDVPAENAPTAGILVAEVLDACDVFARVQSQSMAAPGLRGSALVGDRITLFVDPSEAIAAAGFQGGHN